MALISTWTAEEGTDGAAITTATSGAAAVSGTPLYGTAAAIHGSMGANLSGASAVVFTEPTTGGAGSGQSSTYCKLHTAGSSATVAVAVKQASTFHAKVRFNNANGKIDVTDGSNTVQGTSTTSYTLDQVVRIDVRRSYSAPNLTVTVRLFFGSNAEGTTPDETLGPYTLAVAATPARDSLGPPVAGAVLYVDTHRMYDDTTTWPAPYAGATAATGSGSLTLTGAATGAATGTATGAVTLTGAATATIPGTNAAGAVTFTGAATGQASATATGTLTFTGAATGHNAVTPQIQVNFDDGTTGPFQTVQGATVSTTSAHDGTKGVRLAPDGSGFAALDYNIPVGQQTHPWAAFRGWWRPVVKTADASGFNNNAVLLEIGNTLTVAPKGQLTIYTQNGDLGVDFNTTDFSAILPAFTTGAWHLIEIRCYFGATTFTAYVRIDGTEYVHTSAATQTPASVRALWMKYSNTVTDATDDWDSLLFWYGDSDPGYLDAAPGPAAGGLLSVDGGTITAAAAATATGAAAVTGAATATAASTAAGTVTLTGASTATAAGTTAGAVSFTGASAPGASTSAVGAVTFTGTAATLGTAAGTSSGTVTFTGTSTAAATITAAGTISLTATAAALVTTTATGTLTLTGSSTATAATTAAATSTGTLTLTGAASATGPQREISITGAIGTPRWAGRIDSSTRLTGAVGAGRWSGTIGTE